MAWPAFAGITCPLTDSPGTADVDEELARSELRMTTSEGRDILRTWIVTPTLMLGDLPTGLSSAVRSESASHAVAVIKAGGIAVLPSGARDEAEEVIRRFDIDPRWRRHQLHRARIGHLTMPIPERDFAEQVPRQPQAGASPNAAAARPALTLLDPNDPDGALAAIHAIAAAQNNGNNN
jgi:hypothetical protein